MKFISFKILILSVLLPPIFYIFSLIGIESYLKTKYLVGIKDTYIGDTRPIFDGRIHLRDAINENINRYLKDRILLHWGVKAEVLVKTKENTILYPEVYEEEKDESLLPSDPIHVAGENYKLLDEGLSVSVDIKIAHNTLISNSLLSFYIFLSIFGLYFYYRSGMQKFRQEDMGKNIKINHLLELEKEYTEKLKSLGNDREKLTFEINHLKKDFEKEKEKASLNEDEMIDEITTLEEELEKKLNIQQEQQEQIAALKEEIRQVEKIRRKDNKQKMRIFSAVNKRFKTLYKNITFNEKGIDGFIELTDDMKIKSEEVIQQLNTNATLVPIKRKVFGRKGRKTVFEVVFAYNGRLYYRPTKDNKIEILVIGTKNTQIKDLEFLDTI